MHSNLVILLLAAVALVSTEAAEKSKAQELSLHPSYYSHHYQYNTPYTYTFTYRYPVYTQSVGNPFYSSPTVYVYQYPQTNYPTRYDSYYPGYPQINYPTRYNGYYPGYPQANYPTRYDNYYPGYPQMFGAPMELKSAPSTSTIDQPQQPEIDSTIGELKSDQKNLNPASTTELEQPKLS